MTLEDKLIQDLKLGRDVSIERALLIVSGCETEEQVSEYTAKVDRIQEEFIRYYDDAVSSNWHKLRLKARSLFGLEKPVEYDTARLLFEYLWDTKPNRYNSNFRLTDVIDAQLSEDREQGLGDCVGLTSLYTVLGLRNGLELSVLTTLDHVLNNLSIDETKIPIENTYKRGFNFCNPLKSYSEGNLITLVATVLVKKGNVKSKSGDDLKDDLKDAIIEYDKAIELKPDFAEAFNNRGITKKRLGDLENAKRDYDRAIELEPNFAASFNNRAIVKEELGDLNGSMSDYDKAIELKPYYASAFYNRGVLKERLGDLDGAVSDFNRVIEIKPSYADAFYGRGVVKDRLGDVKGAIKDYSRALDLKPEEYQDLRRYISRLKSASGLK